MVSTIERPVIRCEADGQLTIDAAQRAALRQLMRCAESSGDRTSAEWQAAYLEAVDAMLDSAGLCDEERAPLREIAEVLRQNGGVGDDGDPDLRWADDYARESAQVSYLILTGVGEAEAAQRVARDMVRRKIPLPQHGGDARGWRRLLEFRDRLRHGTAPAAAIETYRQRLEELKDANRP